MIVASRKLYPHVFDILKECQVFLAPDEELSYRPPVFRDEFYATITIKPYMKYMLVKNPKGLTSQMVYDFIQTARGNKKSTRSHIFIYLISQR